MYAVCEGLVKVVTKEAKCSYVDWLRSREETAGDVKDLAESFVSYAWAFTLEQVVEALLDGDANETRFVWMDVFVVNQHVAAMGGLGFDDWARTFGEALRGIGKAELVLMPYENPIPTRRAWCVYEHFVIVSQDVPFEARMSPRDKQSLKQRLRSGASTDFFNEVFNGIDISRATATNPDDAVAILAAARRAGEFNVNDASSLAIKTWLLDVTNEALEESRTSALERLHVLDAKGSLLQSLGRMKDSREVFETMLSEARDAFGPEHASVAGAYHNLARVLADDGENDAALDMAREALRLRQALNEDVALARSVVSMVLERLQRYEEAADMATETLRLFFKGEDVSTAQVESLLREDQLLRASVLSQYGVCLFRLGQVAKAAQVVEESIAIRARLLGPDNPELAQSRNNAASILVALRRVDDALVHLRAVVDTFRRVYGSAHPNHATALNNLGMNLYYAKRFDEALPLLENALVVRRSALRDAHELVGVSLMNLGTVEGALKRYDAATEHLIEARRVFVASCGPRDYRVGLVLATHARIVREREGVENTLVTNLATEAWGIFREALPPGSVIVKGFSADFPSIVRGGW